MSQKEVVYKVICGFINDKGIKKVDGKVVLSKEQKKEVVKIMVELTKLGEVEIKSEKESKEPKKYWGGCVNNWLRKDERLAGCKYEPTYRKGSRKPKEVVEMEKLLTAVKLGGNEEVIKNVEDELESIKERLSKKKVEINPELIPENLRHLVLIK